MMDRILAILVCLCFTVSAMPLYVRIFVPSASVARFTDDYTLPAFTCPPVSIMSSHPVAAPDVRFSVTFDAAGHRPATNCSDGQLTDCSDGQLTDCSDGQLTDCGAGQADAAGLQIAEIYGEVITAADKAGNLGLYTSADIGVRGTLMHVLKPLLTTNKVRKLHSTNEKYEDSPLKCKSGDWRAFAETPAAVAAADALWPLAQQAGMARQPTAAGNRLLPATTMLDRIYASSCEAPSDASAPLSPLLPALGASTLLPVDAGHVVEREAQALRHGEGVDIVGLTTWWDVWARVIYGNNEWPAPAAWWAVEVEGEVVRVRDASGKVMGEKSKLEFQKQFDEAVVDSDLLLELGC